MGRFLLSAAAAVYLLTLAYPQAAPAGEVQAERARFESVIADTGYSVGFLAGYGDRFFYNRGAEIASAYPYVAFPLFGVKGEDRFYRGVWEYKVEVPLGLFTDLNDKGLAGLSPVGLRYNFTAPGGRLVPYVEGTLGALYVNTPREVQARGFNFVETGGVGVRYLLTDSVPVDFQVRYLHISNAGLREPNHGINSISLLLGLCYY